MARFLSFVDTSQMPKWKESQLIRWVSALNDVNAKSKEAIIKGITEYSITGDEFCNMDLEEIHELFDITKYYAQRLVDHVYKVKYTPQYRTRVLRTKKYQEIILSKNDDCLMGYNNADNIKRARMPCGCSFAADTMYRYLKSSFEKDYASVVIRCPISPKKCTGNAESRKWPWDLVFCVADLSDSECIKYQKIISNRADGVKPCPACHTQCSKPTGIRIWRVRCNACRKQDWCWQCAKRWVGSGNTICGNKGCIAEQITHLLQVCTERIIPEAWNKYGADDLAKVPVLRACPKCLTLIEYTRDCKHMICIGCKYEFCFKCMKIWKDCGLNKQCNVEKDQDFN